MGLIVLLRHGQASFGADEYDRLSDLGRRQADRAGQVLRGRALRDPVVICGTLRRQQDTATITAAAMGVERAVRVDPRWNEYDHIGMVTRHAEHGGAEPPSNSRAFQAVLDVALRQWVDDDAPGGWRAFQDGAIAALTALGAELGSGRDAVVATSGGIIAAVVGYLLGTGPSGIVALNKVIVNASFTTIVAGRQGPTMLSFNDHAHFSGPAADQRTYR